MVKEAPSRTWHTLTLTRPLRVLRAEHIAEIDDALAELGSFGEVRVIVHRGKLRFIQKLQSKNIEPERND